MEKMHFGSANGRVGAAVISVSGAGTGSLSRIT
jgi:hypothetical protein